MKLTACKLFLFFYVLFMLGLLFVVLSTEKADLHIALTLDYLSGSSASWVSFQDFFFKYITELGGPIQFVIIVGLLFHKVGNALFILGAELLTALFVFPIKHLVSALRPSLFFSTYFPDVVLHHVDGVTLYKLYSFPSGHTATVFSLMLGLTLIFNHKKWWSVGFFVLAVLTAYSRIYLSQHFAEDVLLGSFIGVVMTLVAYRLYKRKVYPWEDKSLMQLLKR